ncbi:unnamed protein product [Caenorhabditis brenneri]
MANAHSFPLLRLPNLAREHVVKVMNVREQYNFSKLSKKSKIVAKNGTRLTSYVYDLILYSGFTVVSVKKRACRQELHIEIVPNEDHFPEDASNVICLRVEDVREQSIGTLVFLVDLFKISRFKLETQRTPNEFAKDFLVMVRNLDIVIDELKVQAEDDGNQNEMYGWVMENCRDVRRLNNYCSITPDFEWDSEQPSNFESCYLERAPFLTSGHLTRLFWNCRLFQTMDNNHKITNHDLNQLVKLWLTGSSKLEFVRINVNRSFNFQEVMTDIEKVPMESAYVQQYHIRFDLGKAFKIRQENGKEAVVCLRRDFVITTHFNEEYCDLWPEYEPGSFKE